MPAIAMEEVYAAEYAICKQCPLRYCVMDRYQEGAECLYLYCSNEKHVMRLKSIEIHLDEPKQTKTLAELTGIHVAIIQRLYASDILLGRIVGSGISRYTLIQAVNWPAGVDYDR